MNRRSKGGQNGQAIVFRGNGVFQFTLVAGAFLLPVNAALFARTTAQGAAFEFYRYRRFRFRILTGRSATTTSTDHAVGFVPGIADAPLAYAQTVELRPCAHFSPVATTGEASQTVPSQWVTVPAMTLFGSNPSKWWKIGAANAEEVVLTQGQLSAAANSATDVGTVLVEMDYDVEFTGVAN